MARIVAATVGSGELEGHNAEDVITYAARVSTPDHQRRFDTQAEHAAIANTIYRCICEEYPRIGRAFQASSTMASASR